MIVMSCPLFPSSAAAAGSVPTVSLTGISPGATVAGTVNLGATASGDNGVTQVKWYVDNVEVGWDGSSPWTAAWDSRKVSDGVHSALAKAADPQGNWGTSATVSFVVKNYVPPPTSVAVTSPAANTTVSGPVSLTASASHVSGIAEIKWYVDNVEVGWDGSSPSTAAWDSRKVADGTHSIIAKALTGDGVWLTSAVSYFTVANGTTAPAPFPSRLKAAGRSIVDENGYVLPTLKGYNMHVSPGFTWDQANFDAIASKGARINRAVIVWDQFEPTKGVVDATAIANLDAHVARAQAAGIYTLLELHLNVGRTPSWTHDKPTEMEQYGTYGATLTQYLANRYGNPASAKFTKAVVGFGLNEPPLEDSTIRNGTQSIPYLEAKQRQMISWFRAGAPSWIGFVAYGYGSQTPIYNDATQNPDAVDASPTAFDSVGGNVVIDVHDYMAQCTNTDPSCEGRQYNGNIFVSTQGGPMIYSEQATGYTSTTTTRSQHTAYIKPYKTFSTQADIPLMLGEWGWPAGVSGEDTWVTDKRNAWKDAGTVIDIQWNYGVSTSQGVWVARPGGVWRNSLLTWMAAT